MIFVLSCSISPRMTGVLSRPSTAISQAIMSSDNNNLAANISGKNQATALVPSLKQTTNDIGKPKFPVFGTITPGLLSSRGTLSVPGTNSKGQSAFPLSGATNNGDVYPEPQYQSPNGTYYQQTQISRPNSTEPKPSTFNNAAPNVLSRQSAPGQSMVFSPAPAKVPVVVRTLEKEAVE
jgi:hypothetical protein